MQINITGHHVQVTPALKEYVEEKIQKLENRFENITQVHVTLKVEKRTQKAEAQVNIAGGRGPIFADSASADMYSSIDSLTDKLNRLVTKHKEKLQKHNDDDML